MLDTNGDHQAPDEQHAGGLHVEHADLGGGHDAQGGEEDDGDEGGGGDGEEFSQPVGCHDKENIETPGGRAGPEERQWQQQGRDYQGQR